MSRCGGSVHNVKKNPENIQPAPRRGRPRITDSAYGRMMRESRKEHSTDGIIKTLSNVPTSMRSVRRCLHENSNQRYKRMKQAPALTSEHKARRVSWVTNSITWSLCDWSKVVRSDEKKFKMDGPDGHYYYWADKRCRDRIFKLSHNWGDSVMKQSRFYGAGAGQLAIWKRKQNFSK